MYGMSVTIQPTGGLTFRILPGSIVDIETYPFVPPSTFSGWLYRIWRYADAAKSAKAPDFLETGVKSSPYYYLPHPLIAIGAFPDSHSVHVTKRHGSKSFRDQSRSSLVGTL